MPATSAGMTAEYVDALCVTAQRSPPIHNVKQPCEIRRGLWSAPRWPSCFPPWQDGACPLASRGAERRSGATNSARHGGGVRVPWRRDAAPFGAPRGVLRPSGIDLPFDGAFSALALSVPGIGLANYRRGVVVPRVDPGAARGQPCLRMHGGAGAAPRSVSKRLRWRPRMSGVAGTYTQGI